MVKHRQMIGNPRYGRIGGSFHRYLRWADPARGLGTAGREMFVYRPVDTRLARRIRRCSAFA